MMEFTVRIDITERLEKSLQALSAAIFNARVFPTPEECRAKYFADADPEAEYVSQEKAKIVPEMHEEPAQVVTQPEPEVVKPEPILAQHEAAPEPPANDSGEAEPAKKPVKKKSSKKAEIAPETHEEPAQAVTQPEPKKEAQPPADDGMGGMNLMEASQQLIKDIQDAGVEMADANARVRAKANELGLNYGSITCLIKAIGYVEARKAAIGK